jgi:XTP/dITP diphosphohydrolase
VIEDADSFAGNATKKALELAHWLKQMRSAEYGVQSEDATTRSTEPGTRNIFVLADDSGLEVDALGGKPGVHSARFAARDLAISGYGNSTDADNNAKLLRLLKHVPMERRTARFRCVIALATTNSERETWNTKLFTGTCEGRIDFAPRGNGGFGYDPLFIPDGYDLSFADIREDIKNRLSHRAKALEQFRQHIQDNT